MKRGQYDGWCTILLIILYCCGLLSCVLHLAGWVADQLAKQGAFVLD